MDAITEQTVFTSIDKRPILMTYPLLRKTLVPYCKGKTHLLHGILDLWQVGVPQPQTHNGQIVKMLYPNMFVEFARLCMKENG